MGFMAIKNNQKHQNKQTKTTGWCIILQLYVVLFHGLHVSEGIMLKPSMLNMSLVLIFWSLFEGFLGMEILFFVTEEIYTKSNKITFRNNCVKNRKENNKNQQNQCKASTPTKPAPLKITVFAFLRASPHCFTSATRSDKDMPGRGVSNGLFCPVATTKLL